MSGELYSCPPCLPNSEGGGTQIRLCCALSCSSRALTLLALTVVAATLAGEEFLSEFDEVLLWVAMRTKLGGGPGVRTMVVVEMSWMSWMIGPSIMEAIWVGTCRR